MGSNRTGNVTPKMPTHPPAKVSPVEAQALDVLRCALRKLRVAEADVAIAKRGGAERFIREAEARAATARTLVTEARCDLDTALGE